MGDGPVLGPWRAVILGTGDLADLLASLGRVVPKRSPPGLETPDQLPLGLRRTVPPHPRRACSLRLEAVARPELSPALVRLDLLHFALYRLPQPLRMQRTQPPFLRARQQLPVSSVQSVLQQFRLPHGPSPQARCSLDGVAGNPCADRRRDPRAAAQAIQLVLLAATLPLHPVVARTYVTGRGDA